MRFLRLTVWEAFARLQTKAAGIGRPVTGARRKRSRIWAISRRGHWAGWVLLLALGLAGCVGISVDSSPEAKQRLVTERAQARWQVLIKGDVEAAYQFLSTGSKAATSLEAYKSKIRPGMWREAKVEKVECEAEICKAKMILTYDHARMKGIQTPFEEDWIIDKGTAWYVYRDRE